VLRIDQLFFRNLSIIFFATLLITSISGYFLLQKVEIQNHKAMLEKMIDQFYILSKKRDISSLIKEIKQATNVRVTVIDYKGVVLQESDKDPKIMENHLDRPEIIMALHSRVGESIRYSNSIKKNFLYIAKQFDDKFIRFAYTIKSIKEKFFSFWLKVVVLFACAMFGALFIAYKINQKMKRDLESIDTSLDNLLNKNYHEGFSSTNCCIEFDAISKKISKVSIKLEKRERQQERYTTNLKELSKKQSDIISAISHEFKNPIAAITGYTQSIKEDDQLSMELKNRFLDRVLNNAHKISNMIDRLAMAIKLENDTFKPEFTTFKISSCIDEVKNTLEQKYKDRPIILDIEDITIEADRYMYEQLIINLVENALKYSEDEVTVRVKKGIVEVIDRGLGIDQEHIENITKKFFRVDKLTWDNSIGVGLYIVKYILKLHRSDLQIKSKKGIGSTFYFKI
jgi:signal transduction histidine kinase